jgi:HD-GYP domain-containing protein (c-di-GMP phosphodiesterase class II)
MRSCTVNRVKPGDILGKSLFNKNGDLLLVSWTALDEQYIKRIKELGFSSIYIHEKGTEEAEPHEIISDRLRTLTQKSLHEAHEAILEAVKLRPDRVRASLERGTEFGALVNSDRLATHVQLILDDIFEKHVDTVSILFMRSASAYLIEHSIDVAAYTLILGKQYKFPRKVLIELGVAALLHDIGKLIYPHLIEKPPDLMTPEEKEMLQEHSAVSVRIMERSSDGFFKARTAILYHHENQDGSGYPLGVRGYNKAPELSDDFKPRECIYPLAEVLSVANLYDNFLFSPSVARTSPSAALSMTMDRAGSMLNKHVVRTWAKVLNLYPPASTVIIENHDDGQYNGYQGVIVHSLPGRHPQPQIVLIENNQGRRIEPIRVDFSKDKSLRLKLVL